MLKKPIVPASKEAPLFDEAGLDTVVDLAWKQFDNLYIKIPERYYDKSKQYLWIGSIFLGILIQICMKFNEDFAKLPCNMYKVFIILFFFLACAGYYKMFSFAIKQMNFGFDIHTPLAAPWDTVERAKSSKYSLKQLSIREIHVGLEDLRKRVENMNRDLDLLAKYTYISIFCTFIFCILCAFISVPPTQQSMVAS